MTTVTVQKGSKIVIPANLRRTLGLPRRRRLLAFSAGSGVLLTARIPVGDALSTRTRRAMKGSRISLNELLREAGRQRVRYNREAYGR